MIKTALPQMESLWNPLNLIAKQSLVVTLFLIGTGLTGGVISNTGHKPMAQGLLLWIIISISSSLAIMSGWIS